MTTNRALLGYYQDGVTVGLRASLPGYDALTGDSSVSGTFSFDSEWTDVVSIHQVGLTARATGIIIPGGTPMNGFKTTWPSLGYKPFVEMRLLQGGIIYDDHFPNGEISGYPSGNYAYIPDGENALYARGGITGDQLLTVIYKIPVTQP